MPSLCWITPSPTEYSPPSGVESRVFLSDGETASTIRSWIAAEKLADYEGRERPPRGGLREWSTICDCTHTDGMQCNVTDASDRPPMPDNLYTFLSAMANTAIVVKGERAYRLPHRKGSFLTAKGKVVCAHGATRRALIERKRRGTLPPTGVWRQCNCSIDPIPYRASCGLKLCQACPKSETAMGA